MTRPVPERPELLGAIAELVRAVRGFSLGMQPSLPLR